MIIVNILSLALFSTIFLYYFFCVKKLKIFLPPFFEAFKGRASIRTFKYSQNNYLVRFNNNI